MNRPDYSKLDWKKILTGPIPSLPETLKKINKNPPKKHKTTTYRTTEI